MAGYSPGRLVVQSILPLKNAFESNMAKLWIWRVPATGDLKRPFKPPPSMFGNAAANGPQTDKVRAPAGCRADRSLTWR